MSNAWAAASAACAAGCAYLLLAPPPRRLLLRRGIGRTPARDRTPLSRSLARAASPKVWAVPVGLVALSAALSTGSAVLAVLSPALVAVLARVRWARSQRWALERRQAAVVDLCTALAAELRSGAPPAAALERAAEVPAHGEVIVPRAVRAARSGGDVAQALRWDARAAGGEGLRALAACWEVAMGSGSAMAPACSRLARGLRSEQAHRREVAATLAGPRATARLLALLPAAGILMGTGLGVDPMGLLLGTPVGALLLLTGVSLALLGLLWTDRLARAADPVPRGGRR